MAKAFALIVVAVVTGLLVYALASPHLRVPVPVPPAPVHSSVPASPDSAMSTGQNHILPSEPSRTADLDSGPDVTLPLSSTQQAALDIEARRKPFYEWIRLKAGEQLSEAAPADDGSVLVLYLARDDGSIVSTLIQDLVAPYGRHYGFRHARLFVPNPPDNAARYRLYAEADAASDGTWTTFLK